MDLIYRDEVFQIMGAAFEVHNQLGPHFLEPVYQEALALEFAARSIPCVEQALLPIHYKGTLLKKYYVADYLVFDCIIVEIKALEHLSDLETSQVINYVTAANAPLAVLINFGSRGKLEWKRLANTAAQKR